MDTIDADGATREFVEKFNNVIVVILDVFEVADNKDECADSKIASKDLRNADKINRKATEAENGRNDDFAKVRMNATFAVGFSPEFEVVIKVFAEVGFHVETVDFFVAVDDLSKKSGDVVLVSVDMFIGLIALAHMEGEEVETKEGEGED